MKAVTSATIFGTAILATIFTGSGRALADACGIAMLHNYTMTWDDGNGHHTAPINFASSRKKGFHHNVKFFEGTTPYDLDMASHCTINSGNADFGLHASTAPNGDFGPMLAEWLFTPISGTSNYTVTDDMPSGSITANMSNGIATPQ